MVSILAQPNTVHPAYNPVVYYLDSNLKTNTGFRYIIQIYDSGSSDLYREIKVAPRIGDNYGYIDISKIVQDRILPATPDFNLTSSTWYSGDSKVYNYDIRFGEEYNSNWSFSDYVFGSGSFTAFTNFSLTSHSFVTGDQVFVSLTSQYNDCRDALNGYFTVVDVPNSYTVTVNLPFPCSNAVTPGSIIYSDNRKVRSTNQTSSLNRKAFDRAYSVTAFKNYNQNQIVATSSISSASILTDSPRDGFKIKPFQHLTWGFFSNKTNTQQYVWFKTNQNYAYRSEITGSSLIKMVAVGANADPLAVGLAPVGLIQPTTQWYDVFTTQTVNSSSITSEVVRVYVDQRCCKNEIELVFLDRAGAYNSFAFCLNQFEKGTIQRTNYSSEVGDLNGTNPFYYETWDRGLTSFNISETQEFTLNSDWMTDEMSVYFKQLLTSPEVYARFINDDGISTWYACMVQDNNYETQRSKNKKLIRKTITVRLALNDSINI